MPSPSQSPSEKQAALPPAVTIRSCHRALPGSGFTRGVDIGEYLSYFNNFQISPKCQV